MNISEVQKIIFMEETGETETVMDQAEKKERREARLQHLVDNWVKYKLQTYPWDRPAEDEGRQGRERAIIDEMKRLGLVASTTNWFDVRFENLVRDARILVKEAQANGNESKS